MRGMRGNGLFPSMSGGSDWIAAILARQLSTQSCRSKQAANGQKMASLNPIKLASYLPQCGAMITKISDKPALVHSDRA